jgi:hypothetical protein
MQTDEASTGDRDMMTRARATLFLFCAAAALCLTGCGGGGATVGGTLSGLGAGLNLVVQNNGTDNLTLTSNGSFTFVTSVTGAYSVTILTQPVGQSCSVAGGSGTIGSLGNPVTSVAITCAANSSLGGTVSGLPAGTSVTLSNGTDVLPIASNGAYAFPGLLAAGTSYNVTIAIQPAGHACTVSNPSGTVVANVKAVADVSCS